MKRGLAAPFLFLALVFAALGSQQALIPMWFAALVALCLGGSLLRTSVPLRFFTPLAIAVSFMAAWIAATNQWANPSYSAMAPYHAALLFGGFLLGRMSGNGSIGILFRVAVTFGVALAAWAIWQQVATSQARAQGFFVTPATLAAVLNLLLIPALVVAACGERRLSLLGTIAILAAAFSAAQSRGGWIGLGAALVCAIAFARRARTPINGRAAVAAGVAFAAGAMLPLVLPSPTGTFVSEAAPSLLARLSLYALALQGIETSSWLFGSGYSAFFYLLQSANSLPQYAGRSTYFVHNDYLQVVLELGVPGLAGLLAIIGLPLYAVCRAAPRIGSGHDAIVLTALGAAVVSIAVHALVDFPFYIPLCVLVYGAIVGILDGLLNKRDHLSTALETSSPLGRALRAGVATVIVLALALPVAAEAAANYAARQWRYSQSASAAYWFEAARRLNPRDWRYHWYAGQFWFSQAMEARSPERARLADESFAAGYAANPREVRSLLGRLEAHQRLRDMLAAPADPATLAAWADRAVELAPADPAVRAERDRVHQIWRSGGAGR